MRASTCYLCAALRRRCASRAYGRFVNAIGWVFLYGDSIVSRTYTHTIARISFTLQLISNKQSDSAKILFNYSAARAVAIGLEDLRATIQYV